MRITDANLCLRSTARVQKKQEGGRPDLVECEVSLRAP